MKAPPSVWPGSPFPLGATWKGDGVNFALFSEAATKVELCLFDSPEDEKESYRVTLPERTAQVWHGFLPNVRPGQCYGYRAHGAYDPSRGLRFNSNKLLLDPYAKEIARSLSWDSSVLDFQEDTGAVAPLGRVVDGSYDWRGDRAPKRPWHETIVYETHVKGFTQLHSEIPLSQRGTYAALGLPVVTDYLCKLGITAVELLPVHYHVDEAHVATRGMTNYWGYNTLGFFAPDPRYATSETADSVTEFKDMVRTLHAAGLEVILDVVYNHTGEGDHQGPTLSFRGIDNGAYYRLAQDQSRYVDFTGCGNSLNVAHPNTLLLIMDSLRYWVLEMHVDGFRFDLASALARELWEVDRLGAFFDIIHQDPVLSQVKLIAEPWDLGPDGYQVGKFPVGWSEWNGKYRDCLRRFWKGDGGTVSELASRLSGSSDLYSHNGRRPYASVNFITAHDGFTLRDLVSYNNKHNEDNGEENRDGCGHNDSWNCGAEGPTDDPVINQLRARQQRNFLACLFLSQGVPMLLSGDECGRTQRGNNNPYCRDEPFVWTDWRLSMEQAALLEDARKLIELRKTEPVFKRRRFFHGRPIHSAETKDIYWFKPDGSEMSDADWGAEHSRCLGLALVGHQIEEADEKGQPIVGNTFVLLLNAYHDSIPFCLGTRERSVQWHCVLDTARASPEQILYAHRSFYPLEARSLVILKGELLDSINRETSGG